MTVGEKIKKFRTEKGMTQKELGQKCNLADSAIRRYELGGANPKVETLKKIANALKIDVALFFPDIIEDYETTEIISEPFYFIKVLIKHNIFTEEEQTFILNLIDEQINIIEDMKKTHETSEINLYYHAACEKIRIKIFDMFKDEIKKDATNIEFAIIILSCFFSLKQNEQEHIVELLLNHCYQE